MFAQFRALVERALKTGWAEEEVANALPSLARTYSLDLFDEAVITAPSVALNRPLKRPSHAENPGLSPGPESKALKRLRRDRLFH